ncbi:fluoride efflux transporter FluC [Nocardia sp. NPDC058114]|uniref:fluoride efflux transporter FluC n=1 Tax=Nocardia sp. NPDC058114 TaxID=3346346 RepID=UPI0036DC5103
MPEARSLINHPAEPVDPDIDMGQPRQRRELARSHGAILAVISLGGGIGGLARYALTQAWPAAPDGFPWAVFTINLIGSMLLGVLMVVVTEVWTAHPLVRPFLGVGVIGGFTTFSTYSNDIHTLFGHAPVTALAYLATTLFAALTATGLTIAVTRRLLDRVQSEGGVA